MINQDSVKGPTTDNALSGYLIATGITGDLVCRVDGVDYTDFLADSNEEGASCTPSSQAQ